MVIAVDAGPSAAALHLGLERTVSADEWIRRPSPVAAASRLGELGMAGALRRPRRVVCGGADACADARGVWGAMVPLESESPPGPRRIGSRTHHHVHPDPVAWE